MRCTVEKLVFGGTGLAHTPDGKAVFVWNGLPGEEVEIEIIRNKKTHAEAIARTILSPSPDRIAMREDHALLCSPWQIMSFDAEQKAKRDIAIETYTRIAGLDFSGIEIVTDNNLFGYRHKIEYSFAENERGETCLAFFNRGSHRKHALGDVCELASGAINTTAREFLGFVREEKIPQRTLKSLIVRANREGDTIATLFLKDKIPLDISTEAFSTCKGFQIYYSTHLSPASVPTELMVQSGELFLTEKFNMVKLSYGPLSFFQINPALFENALHDIGRHIGAGASVVDLYSGVGAIGLSLAERCGAVTLVEIYPEAVEYAAHNIVENGLSHKVNSFVLPSEKALDKIVANAMVIVDPPRAGLHSHVVRKLLEVLPPRIVYLSCDVATQSRDLALFSSHYAPLFSRLYNFFPRTPHIESLVVLDLKA